MLTRLGGIVLAWSCSANPPHAGADALTQAEVADLIRAVRAGEQWVHEVDGLLLRIDGEWIRSSQAIAMNRQELGLTDDDKSGEAERYENLQPRTPHRIELVFDRKRIRKLSESKFSRQLGVWNGHRAKTLRHYSPTNKRHFAIDKQPYRLIGQYFLADISWLRARPHPFWWRKPEEVEPLRFFGRAEDFTYFGRELFRGIECHVLERNWGHVDRWYVGVASGRLHRILSIQVTGDRRDKWLLDYQEVAPNCWLPMKQGYSGTEIGEDGALFETYRRELKVVEARVNPTLPDATFELEIPEGVTLTDFTHDPPLYYRYKKKMSAAEWQKVLETAEETRENDQLLTRTQTDRVGQPAPPFPQGKWINTAPMAWSDLAGKIVLLDFWSITCGPCRPHLPMMNRMHRLRDQVKVVVIGVHSATDNLAAVEKFVKKHDLHYPIFVESPENQKAVGAGKFFDGFGINPIPYVVVVDAERKISSARGTMLDAVWDSARHMAATRAKAEEKP
jgi:peroxiredoxin